MLVLPLELSSSPYPSSIRPPTRALHLPLRPLLPVRFCSCPCLCSCSCACAARLTPKLLGPSLVRIWGPRAGSLKVRVPPPPVQAQGPIFRSASNTEARQSQSFSGSEPQTEENSTAKGSVRGRNEENLKARHASSSSSVPALRAHLRCGKSLPLRGCTSSSYRNKNEGIIPHRRKQKKASMRCSPPHRRGTQMCHIRPNRPKPCFVLFTSGCMAILPITRSNGCPQTCTQSAHT